MLPSLLYRLRPPRRVAPLLLLASTTILLFLSGVYVPVVSSTVIVGAANLDAMVTGLSPLVIPPLPLYSRLLSADGSVITTFTSENRVPVKLNAVAPIVVKVLLSSEDRTFFTNDGIDPQSIARALLANLEGRPIQGGSTITQQYVKNILELQQGAASSVDTIQRKVNEIAYARQLTRELTKDQILDGYLNTVYFGARAYGVGAAAARYYSITARQLDLQQSAMLVALVQSPTTYDPLTNPTLARTMRNQVLHTTYANHQITLHQEQAAIALPLDLKPSQPTTTGCLASNVPYFCDWVSSELTSLAALGATRAERVATLEKGGLTIRTTLVPTQQAAAETAAVSIVNTTNRVGDAIVVETPGTGAITAMAQNRVYGLDTRKNQTTLNYANSPSPVGSTFKAFTLSAALGADVPLTTTLPAGATYHSTVFDNPPNGYFTNAEPSDGTNLSIAQATDGSVNTAFVQLEEKIGVLAIAKTARAMGLTDLPLTGPHAVTAKEGSLTLGARGFTAIQMAGAYATLAAHGLHCTPNAVTEITLANGTSVTVTPQCTRAISPAVANTVTSLLAGVVTSGTGIAAAVPGHQVAGKTGTTGNFGSAWFDGYTPDTAMAVWMGDPRGITYPLYNVTGVSAVYGGTLPAEMFKTAMTSILQGQPDFLIAPPTEIYLAKSSEVVPDVADLSMSNARALLVALGLVVSGPTSGVAGVTNPPAGTSVSPGDRVTLNTYSKPVS